MEAAIFKERDLQSSNNNSSRMCECGVRAPIWTSWSDDNPGRRFTGCPNYMNRSRYCNFFAWIDPPVSERQKSIVIGARLRSEITKLQHDLEKKDIQVSHLVSENENLKKKYAKLKEFVKKMEEKKHKHYWCLFGSLVFWTIAVAMFVGNGQGNGIIGIMLMP